MGTVDRTPKPCSHKNTTHVHGTYACYSLDQCRCRPCVDAVTSYERTRTRQTAYGRWQPYVDASPARQHVEELRAAGMGLKLIARHSGVAHGALAKLIYGDAQRRLAPSKRIRPETERKILAVQATIDTLGATVHVDATGTRRRLQALVAVGWSQSQLARRLDMAVSRCRRETRRLMARIRSIKPEVRRSLTVAEWPREVRLAWIYLWMYLDDEGRGVDDMRLIVAELFPLDRDVTERKMDNWLTLIATTKTDEDDTPPALPLRSRRPALPPRHQVEAPADQPPAGITTPALPDSRSAAVNHSVRHPVNDSVNGSLPDSLPTRAPADQGTRDQGSGIRERGIGTGSFTADVDHQTNPSVPREPLIGLVQP
jgi:hypothetical protein